MNLHWYQSCKADNAYPFEVSVGDVTFTANKTSHICISYFILALKQQIKLSVHAKYNCMSEDSSYCCLFFKRQHWVFQSLVRKTFYLVKKGRPAFVELWGPAVWPARGADIDPCPSLPHCCVWLPGSVHPIDPIGRVEWEARTGKESKNMLSPMRWCYKCSAVLLGFSQCILWAGIASMPLSLCSTSNDQCPLTTNSE